MKKSIIPSKLLKEYQHFKKTGIPRCVKCKKDFIKVDEYNWKPSCKHNPNIMLSIG